MIIAKIGVFMKRYLAIVTILLLILGCSRLGSYSYNPYEGVRIDVKLKKIKTNPEHKSTFLYFDLQIENHAINDLFFHPGQLKATLNGKMSEETYYDSLASVLPKKHELIKGKSTYPLYFVFPESVGTTEIKNFDLVNFGLSLD